MLLVLGGGVRWLMMVADIITWCWVVAERGFGT